MDELAEILRRRISDRLHWLRLTPITAATSAGLPRDSLRNIFRRDAALPRADTLVAIANALDTTVAFLVGETVNPGVERWAEEAKLDEVVRAAKPIPVRAYIEADFLAPPSEVLGYIDVNVEGFETSDLSAFLVNDRSADLEYEVGRFVIVAPATQVGIRRGDHLIGIRVRGEEGDERVETTIRELGAGDDGKAALVSLSSVPDLCPTISVGSLTHSEMRAAGVVVADYRVRVHATDASVYPGKSDTGKSAKVK